MANFLLKKLQDSVAHSRQMGVSRCDDWAGQLAAELKPECVLDVGCGDGARLFSYFKQVPREFYGAEGAPDFRLVTRATFISGNVDLTRADAGDPVSRAREVLREEIRCDEMLRAELNWMLRQTPDNEKIVPMPGWRSHVHFHTPPGNARMEKGAPAATSG